MKKLIAILLVLVVLFAFTSAALADGKTKSPIYQTCLSRVGTSADDYTGVYLYKVVTPPLPYMRGGKTNTLIKFGTITSDVGFVRCVYRDVGVDISARTAAELKTMTTRLAKAEDGSILFCTTNGSMRVGIYADGYQFYIKGGLVVVEPYRAATWTEARRLGCATPPQISKSKYISSPSR